MLRIPSKVIASASIYFSEASYLPNHKARVKIPRLQRSVQLKCFVIISFFQLCGKRLGDAPGLSSGFVHSFSEFSISLEEI